MVPGKGAPDGLFGERDGSDGLVRPTRSMPLSLRLFLFLAPLPFAATYIGGHLYEWFLPLGVLAFLSSLRFVTARDCRILFGMLPFMLIQLPGIVAGAASRLQAFTELGQMLAILLGGVAVTANVRRRGANAVVKPLVAASIFMALTALFQFGVSFVHPSFGQFYFLSTIDRGPAWSPQGRFGVLPRITGFASEPAHLIENVQLAACLWLAFMSSKMRSPYRGLVVSFVAEVLALSLLGYFVLGLALVLLLVLSGRHLFRIRFVLGAVCAVGVVAATGAFAPLSHKLATLTAVTNPVKYLAASPNQTAGVSSLTLAANYDVAVAELHRSPFFGGGLNSSAINYQQLAPSWVYETDAAGLNSKDGGSLLIRLLSETGLVGAALFVGGWLWTFLPALSRAREPGVPPLIRGLVVAAATLGIYSFARDGGYFQSMFWIPLALVSGAQFGLRGPVRGERRGESTARA